MTFGELLRRFRRANGLKQAELAEKCGLGAFAVHRHETDTVAPDGDACAAYATALKLEGDDLAAFHAA